MAVCTCADAGKDGHAFSCPMRKPSQPPYRVFDDPNHPHYGPVRRMWVVFVQLDLLADADDWGARRGFHWDIALASRLAYGIPEAQAQCRLLSNILEAARR